MGFFIINEYALMGHFKIDPLSFFYEHSEFIPNTAQKNIINAMDSCQFTIIPNDRACGTSTAIKLYMEWEFIYSKEPISLVYSANKWESHIGFERLNPFRKDKSLYRNNQNKLEIETIGITLNDYYYHGTSPDDLYVLDGVLNNESINKLFDIFHIVLPRKKSRFVIITDKPSQVVHRLVNHGVDEDHIGLVDMADCSYYMRKSSVQAMTRQTGQMFKLSLQYQP